MQPLIGGGGQGPWLREASLRVVSDAQTTCDHCSRDLCRVLGFLHTGRVREGERLHPVRSVGGRVRPAGGGRGWNPRRQESWSPESPRLPRCPRPPAVITAAHSARRPSSQQLRLSRDRDLQPGLWGWGGGRPKSALGLDRLLIPGSLGAVPPNRKTKTKAACGVHRDLNKVEKAGRRQGDGLRPATAVTIQKQFRVTNPKRSSRRRR